jgi:Cu(I)/Ag(I) efflux system membrane fusion protein
MKRILVAAAVAAAVGLAAFAGYRYAMHRMMSMQAEAPAAPQASAGTEAGRKPLYWYDPMYPQQRFDRPGKSPFMDMQLVPKYADEQDSSGAVSISPRVVQNLGVRTAEAKTGSLERRFETVGTVAWNERRVVQLQARASGYVEKLHARAPLDSVAKGAPLVEILFPDWAGAQEEYLLLRRSESAELKALIGAARQRLLLLGMTETEIEAVEREGRTRSRITLRAPTSGVVAELGVREGMTVMPGQTLFRLVDLSTVWVNAEVPEAQAGWVRPGGKVEARVAAYPGEIFEGRIGAILPEVNMATRTLRTRIELSNSGAKLKPGMFATLAFARSPGRNSVLVPSEAVIRTGERNVVILAMSEGRFMPAQVEIGGEQGGMSEVRKGLEAGAKVVLSGQFLIDSEASLNGTLGRLKGGSKPDSAPASGTGGHKGRGKVMGLDPAKGRVELEHDPIASLKWPHMTMGFPVHDKAQLSGLKKGDAVEFELKAEPDKDGEYLIERIAPEAKK